jgi:hypothetical protein
MDALRELPGTRQIPGEPRRRWFNSLELDLIVWLDGKDTPSGFQLCYDKSRGERALTWHRGRGYDHAAVDAGEDMPAKHKGTPILVADGVFHADRVKDEFLKASEHVPENIRRFVAEALDRYPQREKT